MIVYLIENKVNNKKYIGQTSQGLEKRWKRHIQHTLRGMQRPLNSAIRKYGPENFETSVIGEAKEKWQINFLEQMYIRVYKSNQRQFGYNMAAGGEGPTGCGPWNKGKTLSPEYRQKLSDSHKGKTASEETKKKMSLARLGKKMPPGNYKWSEERKAAYSQSQKGHKFLTEDSKRKIGESNSLRHFLKSVAWG